MSERMYHINLCKEELEGAKAVILPGDPGRVPKIAALLQEAKPLAQNREYTSWLGRLEGQPVDTTATGIGGPSAAIAVEELAQLGVETFVRVGTCGGMQLDVKAGDLVVVNAAIRMEGTSREYLPIEFPAVADFEVTAALRDEAQALGFAHHVGVVQCKDSFYGQHDPASMPVGYELQNKWNAWIKGGALASEMETAALFTVSSVRRLRAGAVMLCIWNQEREAAGLPQEREFDTEKAIRTAVGAIARLLRAAP